MNTEQERADFEAWIASPPYEKPLGINPEASGFPGQYRAYEVQLAWEAYQAGRAALQSQGREDALEKAQYALMIAQAHAPCPLYAETIEAIDHARQRRGEPSGYAYRYSSHDGGTVIRFNNGAEVNGCRPIESLPYWFAPQPAEPVKVPSESEIGQVLDEVKRNSLYGDHHWGLWLEFARALLARYTNQENSNGGT